MVDQFIGKAFSGEGPADLDDQLRVLGFGVGTRCGIVVRDRPSDFPAQSVDLVPNLFKSFGGGGDGLRLFPFARHRSLGDGVAGAVEASFEVFGGGFEFFDHGVGAGFLNYEDRTTSIT